MVMRTKPGSLEVLKDVEAFHTYCAAHGMSALFPKNHPAFAGLNVPKNGHTKRQALTPTTPSDLPVDRPKKRLARNKGRQTPISEPIILNNANQATEPKKRRGRPIKLTTTSTSGTIPDDA